MGQNRSILKSKGHACAVTRIDGKDVIVVSGGYKDLGELNGNLLDSVELMYEGNDFFKRGKNSLIFKLSCFLRMVLWEKSIHFSKAWYYFVSPAITDQVQELRTKKYSTWQTKNLIGFLL